MWRINDRETSESTEGICAMGLIARLGRHTSLVCLAFCTLSAVLLSRFKGVTHICGSIQEGR